MASLEKAENSVVDRQFFTIEAGEELRFEVETENSLILKSGKAEIFGTEIVPQKEYTFSKGTKLAVFTWHGCNLELRGKPEVAYVSRETPMDFYLNFHVGLEGLRDKAFAENSRGPTVMVAGPNDVGKNTVCKILLNYAVRKGRTPLSVDIGVEQGRVALPGTMGASMVEAHADVKTGFPKQSPLVFHFGHTLPGDNIPLYNAMVSELAKRVESIPHPSGVVIQTSGGVHGQGLDALLHAATAFKADFVLVLDQERLYTILKSRLPTSVNVILTPKSKGVVKKRKEQRIREKTDRIREYFYGMQEGVRYNCYSINIPFSELRLFKVGGKAVPSACRPLGSSGEEGMTSVHETSPGPWLANRVLGMSHARSQDQVLTSNLMGFLCVTRVDLDKQFVSVLSRTQTKPSCLYFLVSEVTYVDY